MIRLFISTVLGIIIGVGIGLYVGWVAAPIEYTSSPMSELAQRYQDDYTVMVASGYIVDENIDGAIARLRLLGVDNIPAYVQDITERYITNSRDIDDIRKLVNLAEGLGRLTPPMERFRTLGTSGVQG